MEQDPPIQMPEVSNSQTNDAQLLSHENPPLVDVSDDHEGEQYETEQSEPIQEDTTEKYELPPRANRGVPPRRYSPEKQTRASRFSMANIDEGNISKEAKDFISSLYAEQIPTTVEEALESTHWRQAMETEIEALMKKTHGKSVQFHKKKKKRCGVV